MPRDLQARVNYPPAPVGYAAYEEEEEEEEEAMEVEAVQTDNEDSEEEDEEDEILVAAAVDDEDDHVQVAAASAVAAAALGDTMDVEDEEEDDEDAEPEVLAAVVVDDEDEDDDDEDEDDDQVEAAVFVPSKPPASTKPKPKPKPKHNAAVASAPSSSSTKKMKSKPQQKKHPQKSKSSSSSSHHASSHGAVGIVVSPQCLAAARDARAQLQETVPTLPVAFADAQVRSFGRLLVDQDLDNKFATASSLYPIGFSCDRFEFSPVHGRVLKVRCSILDGRKIREKQRALGIPLSKKFPLDGPVFRVMWGQAIDEDTETAEYPFIPHVHSAPLTGGKTLATAVADSSTSAAAAASTRQLLPLKGMRVRVLFDNKDQWYTGSITESVEQPSKKKKTKRKIHNIRIKFDDGSTEEIIYPDPDVTLLLPGVEDEVDSNGNVELTELNGKSVTSVVGNTPIRAWGKALVKLGLIDEIMLEHALDQLKKSRQDALQEAKDRLEGKWTPQTAKSSRDPRSDSSVDSSVDSSSAHSSTYGGDIMDQDDAAAAETPKRLAPDSEPPSEREKHFRSMSESLLQELEAAVEEDHEAAVELADARINLQGPFLCNPFHSDDHAKSQQGSWLATAVRKEKMKMGSTGNRKKIVTALDLLERNDTLYNQDIESLIEGLPGSEYCNSYVFQAFRTGGAAMNRQWMHEAQLRREKEAMKRTKRQREVEEKEHQEQEKQKKRKERDDFRDARKRQKLEEEDQKKRARIDERLSRLRVQADERLHSEATFQREKVVSVLARNLTKEFTRRRKAAETVAAQAIVEAKESSSRRNAEPSTLPSISKAYDEDTIRVWNFMTTFGGFFIERGYVTEVPTLDSLQSAIDVLRHGFDVESLQLSNADAVSSLTDLAVALCKPLAASLTRILFASLIALNPTLQKDFGAAFFNEVNATAGVKEDSEESAPPDVLLPVNAMTWQEIARASLLSDALGELGYQRHEAAHFLRGYRSAGHPNSKEARRLRKAEDIWIALVRQEVELGREETQPEQKTRRLQVDVPCEPLCTPTDFRYYLYNIKSLGDPCLNELKSNIAAAMNLLQSSHLESAQEYKADLVRVHQLLEEHAALKEAKVSRKVKNACLKVFEKYAGPASSQYATEALSGLHNEMWPWQIQRWSSATDGEVNSCALLREMMGLLNALRLSHAEYKILTQSREVYMENALRVKEEEKRKMLKEDDDEDDEDEDDDDEKSENQAVVVEESSESKKTHGAAKEPHASNGVTNAESKCEKRLSSENSNGDSKADVDECNQRVGKPTDFDDFCGDIPSAPDLIRRCLAVLRALCSTSQASGFLNPVDPQSNPGYYDTVLRPMCLREVGNQLSSAAEKASHPEADWQKIVEEAVAHFGRNMRLIEQNTLCYGNAGSTVISMASELLRIFERLFLDWVLAPENLLPSLSDLDDDKCVEHHFSDEDSTVLFCDGCEGKYNITRLDPPLSKVPKGDWYCPRCVSGRWWGHLDPRVGKAVRKVTGCSGGARDAESPRAHIRSCLYRYEGREDEKPSLMYMVEIEGGGMETWSLDEVNRALKSVCIDVPPIRCLEAVAESPGYGNGVDLGLRKELVPISANPRISETAAQVSLSSSVFRDTVAAAGTMLVTDPEDMTANEWLRLLVLLTMKCSSSDVIQTVVSKMESATAESMLGPLDRIGKVSHIRDILPDISLDSSESDDGEVNTVTVSTPVVLPAEDVDIDVDRSALPKVASVHENGVHYPVVVETNAVEVVEDMEIDDSAALSVKDQVLEEAVPAAEVTEDQMPYFTRALMERKRRRKVIEDSIAAYCIKIQLRPTVASFEEDRVSQVVDSSLSSSIPGLDFASLRSRRMVCDLCGLSDVSLGAPLVRVPTEEEWTELMPHAVRHRRVHLVAALPGTSDDFLPETCGPSKHVTVRIRLDGDIYSVPDADFDHVVDGGMLEFVPRADAGYQNELLFRDESDLPYVTGSMSAHECCAVAAHNARKELTVQRHRERQAERVEQEAGIICGRSLEIGRDSCGRSYWKFLDDNSLFVSSQERSDSSFRWQRFEGAESIASVMFALGKEKVVVDLKRSYPSSARMLRDGSWKNALLVRKYPRAIKFASADDEASDLNGDESVAEESSRIVVGGLDPYDVGEAVLVESKTGSLLWDAVVSGISKRKLGGSPVLIIDAYRVQYKGWGSRFTEWVEPKRVVEPNENNRLLQDEMNEERAATRCGLPSALNMLAAKDYLQARDRVRGNSPIPDFARIAQVHESSSFSAVTFGLMKAAIIAIEAALPLGSVDNSESGSWNKQYAQQWRHLVEEARGPARLMQCVILLEDMIGEDWIKQDIGYLRSCLPARWKAIHEASPSSLAVRIILLDRSIKYGTVDRKRYNSKKKAGRPGKSQ